MRVSAIIVTYWTGSVLFECLESVLRQSEITEIIVVNNGNSASAVKELQDLVDGQNKIKLIVPGRNTGFAAGCNLGAAQANGDYLTFVNPDCVLPLETIGKILTVFKERPDAWLCGGRLENPDGTEQQGSRREVLTPWRAVVEITRFDKLFPNHPYFRRFHIHESDAQDDILEVPTVSGAFMVIPKRRYERVGGMDDNLFLHLDDSDLCIRIMEHGGKVLFCGHVPVRHHLSTSDVSKTFINWHKTRSSSFYFYKHFHDSYPSWFISILTLFGWFRFWAMVPFTLIRDFPGIYRRFMRH
jgi:N-acetylglucosaminyl-diphospho-decaprenol L-rhamnosyltransferase